MVVLAAVLAALFPASAFAAKCDDCPDPGEGGGGPGGAFARTTVTGTLRYADTGGLRPIVFANVEVWRFANHGSGVWTWAKDRTVTTDGGGALSTTFTYGESGIVYALRVTATNYAVVVWPNNAVHTTPFYQEPGEPTGTRIQRTATAADMTLDFSYDFTDAWTPQHFSLAETVRRGYDYAVANRAGGEAEPLPPANVEPGAVVATTSYYNPVTDRLEIINGDRFDDRAVLHEYAHYVHDQLGTFPAIAALHNGCTATDLIGIPINSPDLAFQEGFANAFAGAVERANPTGTFSGTPMAFESPSCTVTAGPGDTVEDYVAGALSDLDDPGSAEPFDAIEGRFGTVVSILDRELDGNHRAGIHDVRAAWLARGLPGAAFDAILTGNRIPIPFMRAPTRLVAATADNGLWVRDPVTADVPWQPVGHANNVLAMTALDGKLWAATGDNRLWVRDPVTADVPWQPVGHANNVLAMTALDGKLWAATGDNRLWVRDPVTADVPWQPVGHANNVLAMTALDGKLWAATGDDRLWVRDPVTADVPWQPVGHANNVLAMTALDGKLWAATGDNRLWVRDPVTADVPWQPVGHANNVVAMAVIP